MPLGSGGGAPEALVGGNQWILLGSGAGRGTSGRQSVNAIGGWGGATGVLVGGDTWVLLGGVGATGALVGGDTWVLWGGGLSLN